MLPFGCMGTTRNLRSGKIAAMQAQSLALADTICSGTCAASAWLLDGGPDHRAFLDSGLVVGVHHAIDERNWALAIRLASALNFGER